MEKLTLSVVKLFFVVCVLAFVAVGCNGDGDGGAAPADVSGVWQGPYTTDVESGTITLTLQQEGSSVTGTWQAVYAGTEGEGVGDGTLSGTYENGVATVTLSSEEGEMTATISFSGNTASVTITGGEDGEVVTFTVQKQS